MLPVQVVQVQSLVKELRSHRPCGQNVKILFKKSPSPGVPDSWMSLTSALSCLSSCLFLLIRNSILHFLLTLSQWPPDWSASSYIIYCQSALYYASRVICANHRSDHFTSLLKTLQWGFMSYSIKSKLFCLVYLLDPSESSYCLTGPWQISHNFSPHPSRPLSIYSISFVSSVSVHRTSPFLTYPVENLL